MAYRDRHVNPHSIALENYGSMNEKVESLIEPYVPLSFPTTADISSLTIVMIRLPFSVSKTDTGWVVSRPEYVAALAGLQGLQCPTKWVGLLDTPIDPSDQDIVSSCLREINVYPAFIDAQTFEDGVVCFAKNGSGEKFCDNYAKEWLAYKRVNKTLAQAAIRVTDDHSILWIHDFYLMLVPRYLRKVLLDSKIGYFQHIPFPSSEFFRMFPYRKQLLQSLVCSNVIGFNGHDYLCHFLDSCTTVLGLVGSNQGVDGLAVGGCFAKVGVYPATVDQGYLRGLLGQGEVVDIVKRLRESFGNKKIIVGVDKVDYAKGVTHKLLAYERFLRDNPDMRDSVILVQILGDVQDRIRHSPERHKLLSQLNIMITKINGIYGSFSGLPIHHLTQDLSTKELMALLSLADVYFMSSLRDGMNLVVLEFICVQKDSPGVLLLSEFAGAAQCVGAGAVLINPWNLRDCASAIKKGLEMPLEERKRRHALMFKYLETHTPQHWAQTFLRDLSSVPEESAISTIPKLLPYSDVLASYTRKKRRLLVFSVVNVLAEPVKKSLNALQYHNLLTVSYKVKEQIRTIAGDSNNVIVIVSALEPKYMDRLFFGLPVWVAAENGFYYKFGTEISWQKLHDLPDLTWRDEVLKTFKYYKSHTPGSFITGENVDCTYLSWNYGSSACSFEFQSQQAKNLLVHLFSYALANSTAEIVVGDRSIEVRPYKTSPKDLVSKIMAQTGGRQSFDFVCVIGSFMKKDEDLYRLLAGSTSHSDLPSEPSSKQGSLSADEQETGIIVSDLPEFWLCAVEKAITFAQFYVTQPKEFVGRLAGTASSVLATSVACPVCPL